MRHFAADLKQTCIRISLLLIATLILLPSAIAAADPLPTSEIQALNDTVNWVTTDASCSGGSGSVTLTGSDNEQKVFNFFMQQGLNAVQTAAVFGNLYQESTLDPTIMQKGGDSKNPADADPLGWGLAQWTPGSKITGIASQLNITGPIYDLGTQLQIIWAEMTGTAPTGFQNVAGGLKKYTSESDIPAAVEYFRANFEGGTMGNRVQYAQDAYSKYGNSGSNSGGTVSTPNSAGGCSGGSSVNCNQGATGNPVADNRAKVVCVAQSELSLWESQSGYGKTYPGFPYAATGYLKYSQNSVEEWCADFVSWVYNQAGIPLQSGSSWRIASVSGIESMAQNSSTFKWHSASSHYVPQPGDIAIYANSSGATTHTNIFISSSGGQSTYIGGDQGGGPYPGGSIVSKDTGSGYYDNGIIGYVSYQ